MKKLLKAFFLTLLVTGLLYLTVPTSALANNYDPPKNGQISGRSVIAGALSLVVWPGIGQAVNSNKGEKVFTHAVLGLLPPYRVWSCYDAIVDRKGGYWDGRI
ncbi:MAG: hypothetical protein A2287_05645 [Candidatus Melainabacteria bacterium RIFOXYA12_FULL_32_12]|nr:MAG: hypothetical protein A2104_10110 [Candidatus Melainabacteria bacterium GWF2_32_7]OGI23332.1 MAG: hypothetical protein A2255_08150 [Candidatus Melainabacteria bacterium RIFOXYA2_FULL_32_9]OGI30274.1 MAG: hypothetical protein A2287_05645 [Candidatus Melainabacteria bacterium RIFOXYA12_FULL_32_12]